MARTGEFAAAQPYPPRPRWAGDFYRLEDALFANSRQAESRAADFAQAFLPGRARPRRSANRTTDRYLLAQLPDLPSVQLDLDGLDEG